MKFKRKVVSVVIMLAMLASMFSISIVGTSAADNPYSVKAQQLDRQYAYSGNDLGATYTGESTTFKVWAPTATSVVLNLYATGSDKEEGAENLGTHSMKKYMSSGNWTGVWSITVERDLKNTYYTYSITAPSGLLNNDSVTHETQDVYSYAVGVDGDRSMVVDLDSTDPEGWNSDPHVYVNSQSEAVVWEVQVKDFSYAENSGVSEANRGKFLAFTEKGTTLNGEGKISTCVDYLKELGVTHVQINPFYDFGSIKEAGSDTQFNWGYDPKNYGVPEGSFSSNPYDGNVRINECKQMIQALHEAGIGVIMDVVYNHTYSRDSCFNYTVPEYYYRLAADGSYSQQSGCGNDTASERAMYRKYMRDMCSYWINEYHIDGFRFDLMGIHDVETMNLIREDMDKIDSRIIIYGEGWSGNTVLDPTTCTGTKTVPCTQENSDLVSERIGFFNDQIRDGIKAGVFESPTTAGFVSGSMLYASYISYGIRAQTYGRGCTWSALSPQQCVTYSSCHDNMTLYDKLVAINHGTSADYRARYSDCIAQNKLSSAIINSSQGIDFMLAGEEMGRSKDGDNNSYKSAATLNMIDWSLLLTNADLVSYYRGMLELRKAFSPFTASVKDTSSNAEDIVDDSYKYNFSTSISSSGYVIAYTVDNLKEGEWDKVAVLFNGAKTEKTCKLSTTTDPSISENTEWVIVANNQSAGVIKLGEAKGLTFTLPASSALIAVEKSTFEETNIESNLSRVIVNNIDEETGNVISSNVILGAIGTGYEVAYDKSVPLKYEYDYCDSNTQGIFKDKDTVINFYFKRFVPSSFINGDVDGDGKVSIIDATTIQRYLASIISLPDERIAAGDYDYDKKTSIIDVTLLQRYLAKLDVGVYTITTNHYAVDKDGNERKIANQVVREARLGTTYTTEPVNIAYYELNDTPKNATGIVSGNITVDYYYTYSVDTITIHVKHSSSKATWNPTLWAWVYDESGTAINCYDGWPGLTLTEKDSDGWYTTDFNIPGAVKYCIIISNNGSPQTSDYVDLTAKEIWVVIDDENATSTGAWIDIYDSKPAL